MDANLLGVPLPPFPTAEQAKGVPFYSAQLSPIHSYAGDYALDVTRVKDRLVQLICGTDIVDAARDKVEATVCIAIC